MLELSSESRQDDVVHTSFQPHFFNYLFHSFKQKKDNINKQRGDQVGGDGSKWEHSFSYF